MPGMRPRGERALAQSRVAGMKLDRTRGEGPELSGGQLMKGLRDLLGGEDFILRAMRLEFLHVSSEEPEVGVALWKGGHGCSTERLRDDPAGSGGPSLGHAAI